MIELVTRRPETGRLIDSHRGYLEAQPFHQTASLRALMMTSRPSSNVLVALAGGVKVCREVSAHPRTAGETRPSWLTRRPLASDQ